MPFFMSGLPDPQTAVGRAPEQLSLEERFALAGKYIALELYSPATLPLRRIEAIGNSAPDCARQLRQRGDDPTGYEYIMLTPPY
jgi:hypothetical protein